MTIIQFGHKTHNRRSLITDWFGSFLIGLTLGVSLGVFSDVALVWALGVLVVRFG